MMSMSGPSGIRSIEASRPGAFRVAAAWFLLSLAVAAPPSVAAQAPDLDAPSPAAKPGTVGAHATGPVDTLRTPDPALAEHVANAPMAWATRLAGAIDVDGKLDEPIWDRARAVTDLTQVMPDEGRPVSQRTEFRILFDDEALYVGVRAWDTGPITTRMGRRDMPLMDSDWISIVIDSYHDHRTAFTFDVNPGGVRRDATKSTAAGGHERDDNSWDGVWDGAASVDDEGWSVEYRIPFSQLRFGNAREQLWGIQMERVIGRNQEYAVSSYTPRTERGGIAAYGHLLGLEGLEPGDRLELLPYAVARAERVDVGANPYRTGAENTLSGGLDFRFRLTSNFMLNATLNPDFGQVEVDPAVVNLGVYEVFFAEKRPFFVEGAEIFEFSRGLDGGRLFHSRRIGRTPHLRPSTPYADTPLETTILGAGKVSGKTANGWSVGILEAVTAREQSRYRTEAEGPDQVMTAEPLTNYLVSRVRKDYRGGLSSVGALFTGVNRRLDEPALVAALAESAYTVGVDLSHEFAGRTWAIRAQGTASRVAGSPSAMTAQQRASRHYFQRPDAHHLGVDSAATSLSGYSVSASLNKQAGAHWLGSVGGAITAPGYEINDLGFGNRTDRRDLSWSLTYRDIVPGAFFRDWNLSYRGRNERNFANERILMRQNLSYRFRHLSFWGANLNVRRAHRALDDRSTRGGPMMERPAHWGVNLGFNSDQRRAFTLGVHAGGQVDDYDGTRLNAYVGLGFKPSSRWNLEVGPSVLLTDNVRQYAGTVQDTGYEPTYGNTYLFAPLAQTQVALETRFNFTFQPGLTLELYLQPLISAGDFGDLGYLTERGGYTFAPYDGDSSGLDFNVRSLRGNAVLRWEWRKGSNLFLAWQQRRSDAANVGDFDFGRDRTALWNAESDNIFVVKVNYWFSQ